MKVITFLDLGTDSRQSEVATAFANWLHATGNRVCLTSLRESPLPAAQGIYQLMMPWSDERITYCMGDHLAASGVAAFDWVIIDSTEAVEYLRYFNKLVDTVAILVGTPADVTLGADLLARQPVVTPRLLGLSPQAVIPPSLAGGLASLSSDGYGPWFAALSTAPAGWFFRD